MNIQLVAKWRYAGVLDNTSLDKQEEVAQFWEDFCKRCIAAKWGTDFIFLGAESPYPFRVVGAFTGKSNHYENI